MTHQKAKSAATPLWVSFVFSAVVLLIGFFLIEDLHIDRLMSRLLWPLARLMLFISIGLMAGQVIEATGWTHALAVLARPLFRFSHLGNHCSAAFTAAFFSGVSANAMLLDFYKEGKITRNQLFVSNFMNQLPAFFLHLPTTFFIVIPLTGWAGALYFLLTFAAVMLRTLCLTFYGHFGLSPDEVAVDEKIKNTMAPKPSKTEKTWQGLKTKFPGRIKRIIVYVVPIYILIFILNDMGLFKMLRQWLSGFVVTTFIPMEALSVVILSFTAEFTSGFAAAGALLDAGILTVKQTAMALLIGNIIAFPIRALRHQLPHYIGIYSPKMGVQLLAMGQGFRITSIILVGVIYYNIA
ncbi:MAG: nucleoside recognition protein [Desulfobacterales bacterium]|jgi:hypothetical protein